MSEKVLTDRQFRALLDLFMCSDPWPIKNGNRLVAHDELMGLLNAESGKRGFKTWIDAFHYFKVEG